MDADFREVFVNFCIVNKEDLKQPGAFSLLLLNSILHQLVPLVVKRNKTVSQLLEQLL